MPWGDKEASRHDLLLSHRMCKAQLAAEEAGPKRGGGGSAGTRKYSVKTRKFISVSWSVHRRFVDLANRKYFEHREMATHVVPRCRDKLSISCCLPAGQTYEDVVGAVTGRYHQREETFIGLRPSSFNLMPVCSSMASQYESSSQQTSSWTTGCLSCYLRT
jgi:hypothetical protein